MPQTQTPVSQPKPPPVRPNGSAATKPRAKKSANASQAPKPEAATLAIDHTLTELDLYALNREFAERIHEISSIYLDGIEALQSACFTMAADRIDTQFEVAQSLMDVSGPGELSRVQNVWAKKVADQYVHEAYRILDLIARTNTNAWSPVMSSGAQDRNKK